MPDQSTREMIPETSIAGGRRARQPGEATPSHHLVSPHQRRRGFPASRGWLAGDPDSEMELTLGALVCDYWSMGQA